MSESAMTPEPAARFFTRETLIKGQPARIRCVDVAGHTLVVEPGIFTTVTLEDEWFEDLDDPRSVVAELQNNLAGTADLFSFWQRLPHTQARHPYYTEWEVIAALPIRSYEHWWNHQIKSRVRNQIRKAEKEGLVVKEVPYDDEFVAGMTAIFNESPVRQGRPFWHYGKSFETVKWQFARHLHRERMIGAYFNGELVGFIMLADAGRFGITGQIISSLKHRDKAPNNALIAKAVRVCAEQKLDCLVYLFWGDGSLSEFKRRCGFEPIRVPRYWVPLSWKGRLALTLRLQRGWKALIPSRMKDRLKQLRGRWYERHTG